MSVLERWHEEKQSAWIYRAIAEHEEDPIKTRMFLALADAAETQANILRGDLRANGGEAPVFRPTVRARIVTKIAQTLGPKRTRGLLAALKVRGLSVYNRAAATGHPMPASTEDIGLRHRRAGGGGTLRAAVFGVNDGLVSNTSLIMGIAGASDSPRAILWTGIAGLLAGAFSMASGEYVSMRSQRELFEYQIGEEREELERYPDEEAEELALIYNARGVPLEQARTAARHTFEDKERALDTLAREELGLNPDDLGSPSGAALSSFLAFSLGAVVPLVPFLMRGVEHRLAIAAAMSGTGLFAVGAVLSLFSGRNAWVGGLRMLVIGAAAAGLTFAIGSWLGVRVG